MDPQMLLKVVRHQSVLVGGSLITLPTSIFLVRSFQVDMLEKAPAGGVSVVMLEETGCPLGNPAGSILLSDGLVMASVGPACMGDTCCTDSSSFRNAGALVVGEWQDLFGDKPTPVGPCHFLDVGCARVLEGESGLTSSVHLISSEVHQLMCWGTYQGHVKLLESLPLQVSCISF